MVTLTSFGLSNCEPDYIFTDEQSDVLKAEGREEARAEALALIGQRWYYRCKCMGVRVKMFKKMATAQSYVL